MKRYALPLLIVAFAVVGGAAGFFLGGHYYNNPPAPPGIEQVAVGARVPDFAMTDAAGNQRQLDEWRGKLVIVNYWASWCPPCIEEMPMLDSWSKAHGDLDVVVLGIAEDDAEAARGFVRDHPVEYPILIGGQQFEGSSMQLGNSRNVLPYTVVIDRDGTLRERKAGMLDTDILDGWLARYGTR